MRAKQESGSLFTDRAEFASVDELDAAAEAFVQAIGWRNADRLAENLRNVVQGSDAMKALVHALVRDFNVVRQEQIRREQVRS